MDNKILEEIIRLNKDKKPFCTVSKIDDDNVEIIILDKKELTDIQKLAQDALLKDQLIITNYKNEELIINPFNPPLNIIIVGAVHISQYLSKIAKLLDFDVTIIDPREAFASKERFPDDKVINSWPEDCFDTFGRFVMPGGSKNRGKLMYFSKTQVRRTKKKNRT